MVGLFYLYHFLFDELCQSSDRYSLLLHGVSVSDGYRLIFF